MFEGLEEQRYPFDDLIQFVSGGYWSQIEAAHLTIGWLFVLSLSAFLICRRQQLRLAFRLAILYFALALYTNPAYEFAGLKINEVFGILAVLAAWLALPPRPRILSSAGPVALGLIAVFVVSLAHSSVVAIAYPELNADTATIVTRLAVTFKIAVLALNLSIVGDSLRAGGRFDTVVKIAVTAGAFGLCMYVLQVTVLVSGTLPYGTFLDAGYIGVPTFGSVSVERGHFGKFMAPLFPFFLYALLAYRWRLAFALYVVVSLANLSASSLVYFAASMLVTAWLFRKRFSRGSTLVVLLLCAGLVGSAVFAYSDVFLAVLDKIYQFAFQGDESSGGGRSLQTFLQYLYSYPMGIGYGGSTLRTAPGLPEINAAHFAFVTQFSLLALPLLAAYAYLVWRTLRAGAKCTDHRLLCRAMTVGVLVSILIFAADILWFVPTLWLPYEIIWACWKLRGRPGTALATSMPAGPRRARRKSHGRPWPARTVAGTGIGG